MEKAIIVGAYGCGNKGDDAILEGMLKAFRNKFDIIALCGQYGGIKEQFGIETIKCRMNEGFSVSVMMNLLFFFPRFIIKLLSAKCVIIGGGSLLHDLTPYNLPFFFIIQSIAQLMNKKVYYVGVGAGPLKTENGKKACRKYLNKADGVYIRDTVDAELLSSVGVDNVKTIADMAFLVKTDKELALGILSDKGLESGKYIAMTACDWFKSDNFWKRDSMDFEEERMILISGVKRIITNMRMPIVFVPTVYHDYNLGVKLQSYFNKNEFIVLEHEYNCDMMASIIANSYMLFGMRMHSMIFAIRAGIPFIVTIYDQKVKSLLQRTEMLDYAIEFDDLNTDVLDEKLEQVRTQYALISKKMRTNTEKLKKLVQEGVREIIN